MVGGLQHQPPVGYQVQALSASRAHPRLLSLRAMYLPGTQNKAANPNPGEWRLHPEVVQMIWLRYGKVDVDLFASQFGQTPPFFQKLYYFCEPAA